MDQLYSYFGNRTFTLTSLYTSNANLCNGQEWHAAAGASSRLLTVAKTINGKLIGAYQSLACPEHHTLLNETGLIDPNSFIFSLTEDEVFAAQPRSFFQRAHLTCPNVKNWLQTWTGALTFSVSQQQCVGYYTPDSNLFDNELTRP